MEMTPPDTVGAGPEDDYRVAFDYGGDWLGLTLLEGTREEAEQLAAEHVAQFNPLDLRVGKAALQQELMQLALNAYQLGAIVAAAVYTEGGTLLADLVVYAYGEDDVPRPSPEEHMPNLLKWSYGEVKGEPQVSHVDLPVGPAVRIQAVLAEKRLLGWGSRLSESLRYAVWPRGQEEILLVEVDWRHFERTDEIAHLVDTLVPTMRLVPVSSQPGTSTPASQSEH